MQAYDQQSGLQEDLYPLVRDHPEGIIDKTGKLGPSYDGMSIYCLPGPLPKTLGKLPLTLFAREEPGMEEFFLKNFPDEDMTPFGLYYAVRLDQFPITWLRISPEQKKTFRSMLEANTKAIQERGK